MKLEEINHPPDINMRREKGSGVLNVQSAQGIVGQANTLYPNYQTYWPNVYWPPAPEQVYANDIEVTEGEHDVTLRFYRKGAVNGRSLVKEITVPRTLWESLAKRKKA